MITVSAQLNHIKRHRLATNHLGIRPFLPGPLRKRPNVGTDIQNGGRLKWQGNEALIHFLIEPLRNLLERNGSHCSFVPVPRPNCQFQDAGLKVAPASLVQGFIKHTGRIQHDCQGGTRVGGPGKHRDTSLGWDDRIRHFIVTCEQTRERYAAYSVSCVFSIVHLRDAQQTKSAELWGVRAACCWDCLIIDWLLASQAGFQGQLWR